MGSTGQHQEIAQISGRRLGQQIRVRAIPAGLINTAGAVVGRFSPMVKDLTAMMRWFQSGRYVADPTRQGDVVWPGTYCRGCDRQARPQLGT